MDHPSHDADTAEKEVEVQSKPTTINRHDHSTLWRKLIGQPGITLPLYQHITTRPGSVRETTVGACAVQIVRWIVVLILGIVLIWKGGDTNGFWKWITALK
jgi:hypothetical protein